jgi:glycerophosphoryl diester phosphodiesterase
VRIVTRRFVEVAHRARLVVYVWTINDEDTIDELLDLGVDGVMSDRIRLLREVFARRGLPLSGSELPSDGRTVPVGLKMRGP